MAEATVAFIRKRYPQHEFLVANDGPDLSKEHAYWLQDGKRVVVAHLPGCSDHWDTVVSFRPADVPVAQLFCFGDMFQQDPEDAERELQYSLGGDLRSIPAVARVLEAVRQSYPSHSVQVAVKPSPPSCSHRDWLCDDKRLLLLLSAPVSTAGLSLHRRSCPPDGSGRLFTIELKLTGEPAFGEVHRTVDIFMRSPAFGPAARLSAVSVVCSTVQAMLNQHTVYEMSGCSASEARRRLADGAVVVCLDTFTAQPFFHSDFELKNTAVMHRDLIVYADLDVDNPEGVARLFAKEMVQRKYADRIFKNWRIVR